ncbi:MAG: helix-turn-helix transcriptional regulator [Coriobacteriia bacterium]
MEGSARLGRVLKSLRENRNISVVAAARAIGTERHATISEIESGRRRVTFEESAKLAALYGVSIGELTAALSGAEIVREVSLALPRAQGAYCEADALAIARLERLAGDYQKLKRALQE